MVIPSQLLLSQPPLSIQQNIVQDFDGIFWLQCMTHSATLNFTYETYGSRYIVNNSTWFKLKM